MRFIPLFILVITIASCSNKSMVKSPKRQKTPSHLVMSQAEKTDVNYDARETKRVIDNNASNKAKNQKRTEKARKKQTEQLNEANNNTSKVKKRKQTTDAFGFY